MRASRDMCYLPSPSSNTISTPYFNSLPDELLVEILKRLPQNAVHRNKCVSKRCLRVISSHNFIRCYIKYNASLPHTKPPFALFYQHADNYSRCRFVSVFSENPLFKSPGFSFEFLPIPVSSTPRYSRVEFLSSSNGLVLCKSPSEHHYYVCNPLTKQWATIPPPKFNDEPFDAGLICKSTSSGCSFRIVHVTSRYMKSSKLEIYDSESRQWTQPDFGQGFLFDQGWGPHRVAITCNGLIHWRLFFTHSIVIYDPYIGRDSYRIIRLPSHESRQNIETSIGVCNEHMRYIEYDSESFLLWELEDYETGKWRLVQKFSLNEMETVNPRVSNKNLKSLFIHPFDEDIVFLIREDEVIWCNIRLRKLITVNDLAGCVNPLIFPIVLPWWPVPVPQD